MKSYILDAVRTPRGRGKAGKGALSSVPPQELFAQVLREIANRGKISAKDVEDVVVGCVSQAGEQGSNISRNAILGKFPALSQTSQPNVTFPPTYSIDLRIEEDR